MALLSLVVSLSLAQSTGSVRAEVVHAEDVIIAGSLCVGLACV